MTKERILLYFSLIVAVALNLYFRSFPIYFPQLHAQARDIVEKSIQQMAMREVQQKFPQFYPTAKDEIVRTRIAEYKKQNEKIIERQAGDLYRQLKDRYQDDKGQTYLMELDCWHWARYVENVLKYGHPGDEVIDGKQWDMLMLAPKGGFLSWGQLLFYLSAFLYKAFSLFVTFPLFSFLFYLPLFFTYIFIAALFIFSYKYGGGYIGGLLSCLFVGLAPVFIPRSCAGWFDMDTLNLLFPVLIVWAYIISVEKVVFRHKLRWLAVSSFFVGMFSFTSWAFWWYILIVIIGSELVLWGWSQVCYYLKIHQHNLSYNSSLQEHNLDAEQRNGRFIYNYHDALFTALFVVFSLLWVFIFSGTEPFVALVNDIRKAVALNKPLMASIWPNVFSTVGELRSMGLKEINNTVAPAWIVALSLLSMLGVAGYAFLSKELSRAKRSAVVILFIWCLLMFFATVRGVRFAAFLIVPLGVFLGWGANDILVYFSKKNIRPGRVVVFCVIILICASLVNKGYAVSRSIYPLMDDTWYKVLNLIKEKTPQETVINSWWDFGDWFKVVARRRVIFDGQSQHTPQAYWMAKAMLTDNEDESVSILKMLNNGGNKAFEIIDEHLRDPLLSVLLLENALLAPGEKKQQILQRFLPASAVENVNRILTYNPARADFVVDHTMPYKIPAISYLGNWDFSKVYIAQNFDKQEKDKIIDYLKDLGRNEEEIQRFYQEAFLLSGKKLDDWLSQRLQFYGPLVNGQEKDGVVFFDNGFAYNLRDEKLLSNANQIPRSLFVAIGDNLVEMAYPNANVIFSVLIFKSQEGYKSILLDPELGKSMFVRLYFLNGIGLKHFLPFVDAQEGNNYIRVFDIVW